MHEAHKFPSRRTCGFTLIEIMIVVAILGIILAIAAPTWIKQRQLSQTRCCQENLTKINGAKQQWALETNQPPDSEPAWNDLVSPDGGGGYIKKMPICPASGTYTLHSVNESAECSTTTPDHNAI